MKTTAENTCANVAEDVIVLSEMVRCNKVIGTGDETFSALKIDKDESQRRFASSNKK